MGQASLTRWAVRRVLALAGSELTPELRHKAGLCLLDHFACRMAARNLPWAVSLAGADAAFRNGMLGHALIRDDMHVPSGAHIGVVVLPALLALAEREKISGRALLSGIVAGYDIMARLGIAAQSGTTNRHFRPLGISGAYGAAAGAVAALDLDEDVGVQALGFAANFAAGFNEWPWSGGQEIFVHAGASARNALVAIDLARAGMTSSETILEGRDGLFAAYGAGPQAGEIFTADLGLAASILGVAHKPYSGCNFIQTPIAAALQLEKRDPEEIDSVLIRTFAAARLYPGCDSAGPFTGVVQAKMSLQFGVCAALLHGRVDEAAYADFANPALRGLIARCRIETLAEFDAVYPGRQPAEIAVLLRNGQVASAALDDVPWLSREAVEERFDAQVAHSHDADGIKSAVLSLWDAPDCAALLAALD